jgi:hypothetical protein
VGQISVNNFSSWCRFEILLAILWSAFRGNSPAIFANSKHYSAKKFSLALKKLPLSVAILKSQQDVKINRMRDIQIRQ